MPKDNQNKKLRISVVEEKTLQTDSKPNDEEISKSSKDTEQTKNESAEKEKPIYQTVENPDKIPFWILFLAFLIGLSLGAGLIGGIFYYRSKVQYTKSESGVTPTLAPIPSAEPIVNSPSPTPQAKLDLSKYSIQILNGSGIAGEAGRVQELLKTSGFTKTQVGNANSYNFTSTEVSLKKEVSDEIYQKLKESLSKYKLTKTATLSPSSSYDIVITVGKDKN